MNLGGLDIEWWAGQRSRYSDCLRAGQSGYRIPLVARLSARVQTGPEAHSTSCTMGIGSFPGVRWCRGVTLTPHPLLVPKSSKGLRGLRKGETYLPEHTVSPPSRRNKGKGVPR